MPALLGVKLAVSTVKQRPPVAPGGFIAGRRPPTQESKCHARVIGEIAGAKTTAIAIDRAPQLLPIPQTLAKKARERAAGGLPFGGVRQGLRQREQRQPIPAGEAFIVARQAASGIANPPQLVSDLAFALRHRDGVEAKLLLQLLRRSHPHRKRARLPLGWAIEPPGRIRKPLLVRGQPLGELLLPPQIKATLDVLVVDRRQAGNQRTIAARQFAQHKTQRGETDGAPARLPQYLCGPQVEPGEQGVVVEHLLEMRGMPVGIGGVAEKPSTDVIKQAEIRHMFERKREKRGDLGTR